MSTWTPATLHMYIDAQPLTWSISARAKAIADVVHPVTPQEAIGAATHLYLNEPGITPDRIRDRYLEQGEVYDLVDDAIASTHE